MPAITTSEAIARLIRAVEAMPPDDLLEFYNELFPEAPKSEVTPPGDGSSDRQRIVEHLNRGVEIEEILDLWNVAFPEDRAVYYDDEGMVVRYNEEPEFLRSTE